MRLPRRRLQTSTISNPDPTLSPQLEARIRAYFGSNTTRAHLKMAEAPTGAQQGRAGVCRAQGLQAAAGPDAGRGRRHGALAAQCEGSRWLVSPRPAPNPKPHPPQTPFPTPQARRFTSLNTGWRAAPCRHSPCCAAATCLCSRESRRCCRHGPPLLWGTAAAAAAAPAHAAAAALVIRDS